LPPFRLRFLKLESLFKAQVSHNVNSNIRILCNALFFLHANTYETYNLNFHVNLFLKFSAFFAPLPPGVARTRCYAAGLALGLGLVIRLGNYLINYSLMTSLPVVTSADPLFTRGQVLHLNPIPNSEPNRISNLSPILIHIFNPKPNPR